MKRIISVVISLGLLALGFMPVHAQTYNDIMNYNFNGTPANGVKIKTKIPFLSQAEMPTIIIEGYNYGTHSAIGITLVWYIYQGSFDYYSASSWGNYTPPIYLSNDDGFVSIYIQDRPYFQRFTIRAYAYGISETSDWFQGWSVADAPLSGTNQVLVPYKNSFAGSVTVGGDLTVSSAPGATPFLDIQASSGNVLIGKTFQSNTSYKLDVDGKIRANQVTVNATGADYVFDSRYKIPTIDSFGNYIISKHHLPGISSAKDMQNNGMNVGNTYMQLLGNVEKMALYIVHLQHEVDDLKAKNELLRKTSNR